MQDYIYSVIAFVAMAIVLQIVWPLWPYYALGCLSGEVSVSKLVEAFGRR